MTDNKQQIVMFLIHNQTYIKKNLKAYTDHYEELKKNVDPILHNDLKQELYNVTRHIIAYEVVKNVMNTNPEEVYLVLEEMNIKEYLEI